MSFLPLALLPVLSVAARLPDGRLVECVQISRAVGGKVVSWKADGARIPQAEAIPLELLKYTPRVGLIFRVPLKKDSVEPAGWAQIASKHQLPTVMFGSDIGVRNAKKIPGWLYFVVGYEDPKEIASLDMECQVTDGPHIEAKRFPTTVDPDKYVNDFPRLAIQNYDSPDGKYSTCTVSWGVPRTTPFFMASKVVADLKDPVNGKLQLDGGPTGGKAWMSAYAFATPLDNVTQFRVFRRDTQKCLIKGLPLKPRA